MIKENEAKLVMEVEDIIKEIDKYKLYQQQTQGGIYYILALNHIICV